jgi:hypothetical protein
MPCFDGEASEILMHPLGTAFNVGDDHANHLSGGHALWAAWTGVRRQKFNRVSQPRNNASAHSLVNSLSIPGKRYPISACRHKVIRAPSVRLRLRIRIFSQKSGGQEPKHNRRSGVASCVGHDVPSIERLMTLLTATGDQGVPLALGTPRAVSARATPRSVVAPLAWISRMMGSVFAANWSALLLFLAAPSLAGSACFGPTSFLAAWRAVFLASAGRVWVRSVVGGERRRELPRHARASALDR